MGTLPLSGAACASGRATGHCVQPVCLQAVGGRPERPGTSDQWRKCALDMLAWRCAIQIDTFTFIFITCVYYLSFLVSCTTVWLSDNALFTINKLLYAGCRTRLILGWVTVCRRTSSRYVTSHLCQLSLPSLRGRIIEYQVFWLELGGVHSLVPGGR